MAASGERVRRARRTAGCRPRCPRSVCRCARSSYNKRVLPSDAYAALRHPFVRSFAIGRFAAIAGWQMINVAVGWLLYERTGDAWALGLVGVAELAPVLLLMVVAGNAADRYPRRNIGIFAHTRADRRRIGAGAAVVLERPDVGDLLRCCSLIGTARAFASPSVNTILPQLLAPAEFANANAWLSSTFQLAAISGPAIGGMLIAATGGGDVVRSRSPPSVNWSSSCMLRTMPVRVPPPATARRSASDVFAGFRFVRANPLVPVGDHARSVRGAVRRRGGAAADLREGHPAGRSGRARMAARGAGPRRAEHGADHDAAEAVGAAGPGVVVGGGRIRPGDDRLRPVALVRVVARSACSSPASSTTSASSFA